MSYPETLLLCACISSPFTLALFEFAPWIGAWLDARAARKTLRLLHAVAFWAAEPDGCE